MSPLPSVDAALARVLEACEAIADRETVDFADADGRVLARDAVAGVDLPGADVSIMDGWAVAAADVAQARACGSDVVLTVAGESAAGHPAATALPRGAAARISTGAVLPEGADAVVAQEDTRRDGDRLVIDSAEAEALEPGRFVRRRAQEVRAGEVLLSAGHRLAPGDLALLAGAAAERPVVHRRPRVAIVATGDELVAIGSRPAPGQVVAVSSTMLAQLVRRAGADPWVRPDVRDDPGATKAAIADATSADVVITTGGISVGDHDHVAAALQDLGARVLVRGLALRPGKPTTIAMVGRTLCICLAGNPASTLVAFELMARPALLRLGGVRGAVERPWRRVTLRGPVPGAGRREHYVRVRMHGSDEAEPLPRQLSGDLRSISDFDAFVRVPAGHGDLVAGATADAMLLSDEPVRGALGQGDTRRAEDRAPWPTP
jgi:molybdopterin molybdotransferase